MTSGGDELAPAARVAQRYVASLRGCIGDALPDAFYPLAATTGSGRTLLRGPIVDQAALYGVLAKIQSLGLELDELRHDPRAGSSEPPENAAERPGDRAF